MKDSALIGPPCLHLLVDCKKRLFIGSCPDDGTREGWKNAKRYIDFRNEQAGGGLTRIVVTEEGAKVVPPGGSR